LLVITAGSAFGSPREFVGTRRALIEGRHLGASARLFGC
jgi:hypothetical protein